KFNARPLALSGHVGFDSLPDQLVNKSTSQGFCFNILCIGKLETQTQLLQKVQTFTDAPEENTIFHAPALNASCFPLELVFESLSCLHYQHIVDYIDTQFESYLQEELKIKRSLHNYHDSRIHACLYFIAPSGHSLKSLDLVTMKKLDSKVNIIPVIAKADTISKSELHKFKIKIMSELVSNGVQIYQFPIDDETVAKINTAMNGHLPFAVVGSTEEVSIGNKMVKARQYPWGVVQVENENHCDFVKLREMLICVNMEDLREQTHTRHYELYRRCKLEEMGFRDTDPEYALIELKKCERSTFKFEQLKRMHAEEKSKLEEKRRSLEEEMSVFSKRKAATELLQAQAFNTSTNNKKDKDRKK
uniref:Septin n=1 Tax=Cyprinus carpio TaxID=7962 RepID=A0A8C1WYL8_CYPCA